MVKRDRPELWLLAGGGWVLFWGALAVLVARCVS
jgi:hypothetical protein